MQSISEPPRRRFPTFSVSSAALPFIGAAVGYAVLLCSHGGEGAWSYILVAVLVFLASAVAGTALAVAGMIRHERPSALPAIAFILNALPAVCVILSRK